MARHDTIACEMQRKADEKTEGNLHRGILLTGATLRF